MPTKVYPILTVPSDNAVQLKPKTLTCVGWVEERNPTFFLVCWVSLRSTQPTTSGVLTTNSLRRTPKTMNIAGTNTNMNRRPWTIICFSEVFLSRSGFS
ncbi:hypothetical protein FM036_17670 [Nostoc sp. HG1]|nr:hypothetical protein [Nostoc sp. HG1]